MKYIRKEEEKKILLSTYLTELEKVLKTDHIPQDEKDYACLKHLIALFGDIELEESLIKEFIRFFSRFGERYSVLSDDDTFKGLLEIKREYPFLSTEAISDLGFHYIKDLFDTYSLDKELKVFFDVFGIDDIAFTKYLEFVDKLGEVHQKKYDRDAEEIEYLEEEYGKGLKEFLQFKIRFSHMSKDKLLECLPEKELIKEDEETLFDFATRSRIHFGVCYPKSYSLIIAMSKDGDLSSEDEELSYYSSFGKEVKVPFTKTEFIESVKKRKDKKLEKKL